MSCEAWQRIHADYCGPFLGKFYALVIIDSYSKWPEVILTNSATAEFTQRAFRKVFSREGVPQALVTDNGPHFVGESFKTWIASIGCKHLYAPPRHPQSNGLAENFVKTQTCHSCGGGNHL
jgi:putative transposase